MDNQSSTTGSIWNFELCKSWIAKCHAEEHYVCNLDRTKKDDVFPSRLIYVGSPSEDPRPLRLHLLSNNERPTYLTLSHCWGGAQVYTLNPETKHEMTIAIPMEKLARNFQDAIQVTRKLGYSYLWIDSLCIIQNQQRVAEWEIESAKDWTEQSVIMGDIYRNSDLTIAATGAANSHVGFLNPPPANSRFSMSFHDAVEESPLCQRAWVFQERLLSPRMLHFTASELFWECRTMTASESNPTGSLRGRKVNERVNGTRYPTITEIIAFERDLETKLNLSQNRCSLGHETYRDSQRRFMPPHMWHTADRTYAQRFGGFSGRFRRLQDMDPYSRGEDVFGSGSSRVSDADLFYHSTTGDEQGFARSHLEPSDATKWNESDMGWDGFRGSFAALTKLLWSPQVFQPIAPAKTEKDALLFHQRWYDLVKVYSAGKLTFQKDKLMAISSIVREIQQQHPKNGYADGLWEETLLMDLLWRVDVKSQNLSGMGRKGANGLPSWTWASMDCRAADGLESDERWDEIAEKAKVVEVTPSNAIRGSRHGRSTGILRLRGIVAKCKIAESGERYVIKSDDGEDIGEAFPDFKWDLSRGEVYCMGIIEVHGMVRGLVLSIVSDGQGKIVYSRCGYFSTNDKKVALLGTSLAEGEVLEVDVTIV